MGDRERASITAAGPHHLAAQFSAWTNRVQDDVNMRSSFHYAWVIAATGVLVLFSCIGLARFGYTVLIPGMQAGLQLSYQSMGYIGTSNFAGYLLAVCCAPALISRIQPRATVVVGLLLLATTMLLLSRATSLPGVCLLYSLTGVGTGLANIPMMALTTRWFGRASRGRAAGLVVGGNGIGIIFVGFAIPLLGRLFAADGWRAGWLLLGLLSLTVALIAALSLRNEPAAMGLEPFGENRITRQTAATERPATVGEERHFLLRLGLLYCIFGTTFMIYGTFIVTSMVNEYGFSEQTAGLYWSWVGLFSLFSGIGFGTISDRIGRRYGMMLVFTVQTIAYLLAGAKLGQGWLLLSITLYGLAVFAAPAIVTAAIGDYFAPEKVARSFATATLFFAVGQTAGPAFAGLIGGADGSFTTAYLLAALLTALAAALSLSLPGGRDNTTTLVGDRKRG